MKIIGIIPARMGSSRFPNKPMAKILGIPMIEHVYHRAKLAEHLDDIWVATCDKEIYDHIVSIGGHAVMTADTHERASERVAEALIKIEKEQNDTVDYALMIQGDEPMLDPEMLDQLCKASLKSPQASVLNTMSRIKNIDEFDNQNVVKVVVDSQGFALYFSREPIPSRKKYKSNDIPMWKQLGLILFRRDALLGYINMKPTILEIIESVDMNRYLENKVTVKMVGTDYETCAVDTQDDLVKVNSMMKNDLYVNQYIKRNIQ